MEFSRKHIWPNDEVTTSLVLTHEAGISLMVGAAYAEDDAADSGVLLSLLSPCCTCIGQFSEGNVICRNCEKIYASGDLTLFARNDITKLASAIEEWLQPRMDVLTATVEAAVMLDIILREVKKMQTV